MSKSAYVFFFVAVVIGADAIAPVGDEPMWKQISTGFAAIPDMMKAHEEDAAERAATAFTDRDKIGLKPIFGGKGYVETGLPKGPMFGRIEEQIRQGERDLEGWKPPQVSIPRYSVR